MPACFLWRLAASKRMEETAVLYRSRFSWGFLLLYPLVAIALGYGAYAIFYSHAWSSTGVSFIILLILLVVLVLVAVGGIYLTFTLKKIIITRNELIFTYPLLRRRVSIPWHQIDQVKMDVATTKTSAGDMVYRTGRSVNFKVGKKSFYLLSFNYSNFPLFLRELDKRLDSTLKREMKNRYKGKKKDFLADERAYKKLLYRYLVPASIVVLLIVFFLKYL